MTRRCLDGSTGAGSGADFLEELESERRIVPLGFTSSPYANNNVPRRNSLQRIVFYSGQRIVLPTPSGALLDLIMCISQGP
jgi:hypothetical protein